MDLTETEDIKKRWQEYTEKLYIVQLVKNLPAMQETWVGFLGWEELLEEEMATHSSILAWRIPWTEEPGRLQSLGSTRVGHDLATKPTNTIQNTSSVLFNCSVVSNSL